MRVTHTFCAWRRASPFALAAGMLAWATPPAAAQSPPAPRPTPASAPVIGTLGPDAARALGYPPKPAQPAKGSTNGVRNSVSRNPVRGRAGNGAQLGGAYVPYLVSDAPVYSRGGSTQVVETPSGGSAPAWYPTMPPPAWRIVPDEHPVQAWRTVDVDDVVCNAGGVCSTVTTRLLAKWVPALRAYAFVDRVGRMWRVE